MDDTAQLAIAAETDKAAQIDNAADAFKAFLSPEPQQPRKENGQFASPEEELDHAEAPLEDAEVESELEEDEAAEEEPAQPLPPSWPEDQAEHWKALPPETREFLAAREGERERAVQAKFQESANARKEAEATKAAADAKRSELTNHLMMVTQLLTGAEPNPVDYGLGTGQYNQEAFELARYEYGENQKRLAQLNQQLDAMTQEAAREQDEAYRAYLDASNGEWAPRFVEECPDLQDQAKAAAVFDGLFKYAIENGIPAEEFEGDRVSRLPLAHARLLWKAQQYDKLLSNPPQAKPKPASPAVRPGVSSPRSAQKAARTQQVRDRLAREGSIEAGAAVWKSFMR